MSWGARYPSAPTNRPLTALQVMQSAAFGPAVLNAIQDPRLRSYLVDKSVPWSAVDLPLVTDLPLSPADRAEVNYLIDETNEVVVRMVYRAATDNWVQVGALPLVTTLPSVTTQGFQIIYDAGDGIRWHLVYDSSDGTTYPWLFIGGSPLYAEVTTSQSTTSTSYADLSTVGPSVTLPLAGDYVIAHSHSANTSTANEFMLASPKLGSATASDTDAAWHKAFGSSNQTSARAEMLRTGLAASAVIKLQYRTVGGATVNFENRVLAVRPKRVGA